MERSGRACLFLMSIRMPTTIGTPTPIIIHFHIYDAVCLNFWPAPEPTGVGAAGMNPVLYPILRYSASEREKMRPRARPRDYDGTRGGYDPRIVSHPRIRHWTDDDVPPGPSYRRIPNPMSQVGRGWMDGWCVKSSACTIVCKA